MWGNRVRCGAEIRILSGRSFGAHDTTFTEPRSFPPIGGCFPPVSTLFMEKAAALSTGQLLILGICSKRIDLLHAGSTGIGT